MLVCHARGWADRIPELVTRATNSTTNAEAAHLPASEAVLMLLYDCIFKLMYSSAPSSAWSPDAAMLPSPAVLASQRAAWEAHVTTTTASIPAFIANMHEALGIRDAAAACVHMLKIMRLSQ
jgi:hypothetical protein